MAKRESDLGTHTFALETVALVAGETGTLKATEGVRAVREYITGSILALIFVCNNNALFRINRTTKQKKREGEEVTSFNFTENFLSSFAILSLIASVPCINRRPKAEDTDLALGNCNRRSRRCNDTRNPSRRRSNTWTRPPSCSRLRATENKREDQVQSRRQSLSHSGKTAVDRR